MSTEIARVEFTSDQVELLKRTLCKDTTNDELALFMTQCRRTGLDPFARQIHAVKRGSKLTIQVGIDGFRLIAVRTGELDGQEGPYWCGEDGVWKDVWVGKTPPTAAKVIAYRKGCTRGFVGVAKFNEYAQYYNGNLADMWARMSANQIAKCAEALALRKGFPQELSGLYVPEELEHDAEPINVTASAQHAQITQPKPEPAKPKLSFAEAKKQILESFSLAALKAVWDAINKDSKLYSDEERKELVGNKEDRKLELMRPEVERESPEQTLAEPTKAAV